jgi:hypothetical protein
VFIVIFAAIHLHQPVLGGLALAAANRRPVRAETVPRG